MKLFLTSDWGRKMRNAGARKRVQCLLFGILLLAATVASPMVATATVAPATYSATLRAGQSAHEHVTVSIPDIPPKVDVVFAFDLTGSMGGVLDSAKAKAADMMASLSAVPGANFNFGVVSHMDYPGSYVSTGTDGSVYDNTYGDTGDYPYHLDQPVTTSTSTVSAAISALNLGYGADSPESYERVMFESYSDPGISWRSDAKKVVVHFGDDVPHDLNLNEGVPGMTGVWNTGGDPGRDGIMDTADDIDLQKVLAGMASNGVTWIECHSYDSNLDYWGYWAGLTGGGVFLTGSDTLVDDVTNAVTKSLAAQKIMGLHLSASPADMASWAELSPVSIDSSTGVDVGFEATFTVPPGTHPKTGPEPYYAMTLTATDANGVVYGTQDVKIYVVEPHTLTYLAGAGGSIDGSAVQIVDYGADGGAVTAVPATGFHFVKWSDDVMTAARQDKEVKADLTVTATFEADAAATHTLTYLAGAGGTIDGSAVQVVNDGSDGTTVTATPATGFHFVKWSDDVMTAARQDLGVKADLTVTATFESDALVKTCLERPTVCVDSHSHHVKATFWTRLKPSAAALTGDTELSLWHSETRREKHRSCGRVRWVEVEHWELYKTITMTAGSCGRLTASTELPHDGKWKVSAAFEGSTGYAPSTSCARTFSVK